MRRAARTDGNHAEIVKAMRRCGFGVVDLSRVGMGCPDLLACGFGQNVLLEVKSAKGKLTPDQERFHAEWRGPIVVVSSVEAALAAMRPRNAFGG